MNPPDPDKIHMISQPLTDSEGRLNPACMNELEATIAGMPKSHQRLAAEPEWAVKKWTFRKDIVGAFAMWACRQSPYGVPDGLEDVCKYLNECLKTEFQWPTAGMQELSLCEINKALHDILYDKGIVKFDAWNQKKRGKTAGVDFTSRFDNERHPDDDFIDLDALLHNVCLTIRGERRAFDEFNRKFEADQAARKKP